MNTQKPLNIVHVLDLNGFGGVERILFDFIKYTSGQGHVHYASLLIDSVHPKNMSLFEKLGLRRLPFYKKLGSVSLPKKPKFIREQRHNLLLQSVNADVVLVWSTLARLEGWVPKGVPTVYYDHGQAWCEAHDNQGVQHFLNHISSAIAVSFASKRMLQLKWKVQAPIQVVLNQLGFQFDSPSKLSKVLNLERPICLGMAGRLSPEKCIDLFILAVKVLRDRGHNVVAKIVGSGPEYERLNTLIMKYQLAEYVDLPNQWVDDMPVFYGQIDIAVSPSMHETCSLSGIEAMSMGLPAVVSNIDGQPELVEHGVSGMCVKPVLDNDAYQALTGISSDSLNGFSEQVYLPDEDCLSTPLFVDPEHLADAVEAIIQTPDIYSAFSMNALKKSSMFHDFEGLCDKIIQELYRVVQLSK